MKLNWKTLFLLTTCCTLGLMTTAKAQVSPDGTLSTTVITSPNNLNFTINNGNRVGGNLFHSFREFSVPNGGSAVFQNAMEVRNIISRVTGGSLSQINGLIQTLGTANLFLINPAGISFGQNARLSIGGSFFATTADSLLFDNGFEFSATNPQAPPLLTVNIPIGLRFRDNPGNITNQSVVQDNTGFGIGLQVNPGNSLALVGGNVSLEQGGRLTAAGGRIELGGLAGAGTVGLQTNGNTFRLNFPANGLSNVSLLDDARVAVRSNGGGEIAVNTNIFTATNGGRLVGGIEGIATRNGGDITVNSNEFNISGVGQSGIGAGISEQVVDGASGNAGNIFVNTKSFNASSGGQLQNAVLSTGTGNAGNIFISAASIFTDGAELRTTNAGTGSAGSITLNARDQVSITNNTNFFSNVTRNGQAGDITIKAGSFSLLGGSQLQSGVLADGQGNGGNVRIDVPTGIVRIDGSDLDGNSSGIFNDVESGANGNAGNIFINAGSIFTNGAELRTSNAGTGLAGSITLNARDQISIAQSQILSQGNRGRIFIGDANSFLPALVMIEGANTLLNTSNDNAPNQNAGSISIAAGRVVMNLGEVSSSTFGSGRAGDISIQATGLVEFVDNALFSNVLNGAQNGQAGNITIKAGSFSLLNGAQLQSSVLSGGQGNGGNVRVDVDGTVRIAGRNSQGNNSAILNNVESRASGNAGNILINARNLSLINDARINSNTSGQGNAGNVTINASDISFDGVGSNGSSSGIFSSVTENGRGNGGSIDITTKTLSLTNGAQIGVSTFGMGDAGTVKIQASDISFDGVGSNERSSGIFSNVQGNAVGNGGGIEITTGTLSLTNGAIINASTFARGNAGIVKIQASDTIKASGVGSNDVASGIRSNVQQNGIGNGGGIDISTKNLFFSNGAQITAITSGQGNAGNISLNVSNAIALTDSSFISTNVQQGGSGISGDIDIQGRSLTLTNGSQIQAALFRQDSSLPGGIGTGGSIKINTSDFVDISGFNPVSRLRSGIFASAETGSTGPGGSIDITTGAFRLSNSGIVTARNDNGNNGGDITINAKTFEATNGLVQTILSGQAEAGRLFSAGDIELNVTDSVSLKDGSLINSSTFGRGNAGNISLQVGNAIALANSSYIASIVGRGGEGIGGDIDIRGRSFTLTGGSQILTALFREGNGLSGGKGRAGNIDINATDFINILGVGTTGFSSGLFASAETGTTATSRQAAGNINLTTGNFRIADGAVVDALTYNSGNAGNITINANTFTASGGGQLITTTLNSGSAGNINLNVRDRITISGSDPNFNQRIEGTFDNQGAASGIFANTAPGSTGNGGNITIQPLQNRFPTIAISDGAEVTVDSQGQGQGGEISITGNSLTLDRGVLNASTASGDGGNINLRLRNFIRLRNESLISASAGGNGNGGNITINSPFIVAFPRNNDIIANAGSGSGGRVTINATLFGINPLSAEDLRRLRPDDLDPRQLPTSDITAISRDNPSLSLPVQVNSPDVDPSRGLVELPEAVTDPTQKVAENPCKQGIGNEFFVTGRGGLPTTPNQTLSSDNVRVDLLQPVASSGNSRSATKKPATTVTARRVPAQGWIFNDKGQVVLTAYDPTNTDSQRPFSTAAACPAR